MDVVDLPQAKLMRAIELLGTSVAPALRKNARNARDAASLILN
jgi:hypothetical protein